MAQIFVAHSRRDTDFVDFFYEAFLDLKVTPIFEEFEEILEGGVASSRIMRDIANSNAVFVLLSQNVQNIPHTRDWVVWETGVAKNKDLWIFEPYSQFDTISTVIPHLSHYVVFDTSGEMSDYLRAIIASYDDAHVLPTVLLGTLAGAGVGTAVTGVTEKDRNVGAALGGIGGALMARFWSAKAKYKERPMGLEITCANANCNSQFHVHIPEGMDNFRCPVCNSWLEIADEGLDQ